MTHPATVLRVPPDRAIGMLRAVSRIIPRQVTCEVFFISTSEEVTETEASASLMGEGGRDFLLAVRAEIGAQPDARALSALLARRDTVARNWSMFMADHPLVLTPTWTRIPFEHGWDAASPQNAVETLQVMRPVVPANLLGLPSACVPVSVDPDSGMPVGVLVTGRHMHDLQCLAAAEVIEGRSEVRTPVDPVW